ncbi:DUF1127 domain-containing protein [Maritimibacter fusiformis]|jgi:uncharacterized protein YjiS (DUF1127 family)|uniref:DUF1127 domain-containing protein n=1 Tax=Maritimibacter fusiformis TaxID=2603819 RepID=A0A5D0RH76_9RHOB|nr:DUF1127 domain-containing protein [Maritimibacter fusiformis]TYB80980.1 DUF1127 domain-containing protein [Maritimibacter fusiformis]
MAYASHIQGARHGFFGRVDAVVKSFAEARAQRRVYRQTLNELRDLTSRDLADLGIARSEIPFIAREAAYGKA